MARKPQDVSIYRIAKEAGVAVSTVSRVINKRSGISEATREKINRLLIKYDFIPNYPVQRAIRIAVVVPSYYFTAYIRKALGGIFSYTQQHHMAVNIVIMVPGTKESLLEMVREQQCAGVIAVSTGAYKEELLELANTELLTVVLDERADMKNIGFIDNDSYSGSCAATKHLLELGHTRIGYISFKRQFINEIERFKGFEHTMQAAGCKISAEQIIRYNGPTDIPVNSQGEIAMRQLFEQASEITAVMAAGDHLAGGAMTAIHKTGLRIPEDISVVGFDNYPETVSWYPALTTVDHPIEKGGYMAAEAIHEGLNKAGNWIPPQEILQTKLIVRDSTGPAKNSSKLYR